MTIGGGFSKAYGEGSEDMNLGYNGSFSTFFGASENIYLGCKIGYNYIGFKTDKIKNLYPGLDISAYMSILEIIPSVRIMPFNNNFKLPNIFVQAGYGYYDMMAHVKASYHGQSDSNSDSEEKAGINLSCGIIGGDNDMVKMEIAPSYNIVFTKDEHLKYFTVNLCLVFN